MKQYALINGVRLAMYSQNSGKLKDAAPDDTIRKIRNIISDLGLLVTEKWFESVNGIYSVLLQSVSTRFTTNGKGTSQQYALASGYGEFMERLQNGALYMYKLKMSREDAFYGGFVYAPDEVICSVDDVMKMDNRTVLECMDSQSGKTTEEMLRKWEGIQDYHTNKNELFCLPFFDTQSKKVVYIPVSVLFMKYGTNGMCAGNTPEEAMVQGLSEIVERYVNFRILDEKVTPPIIPDNIIANFPLLLEMKRKIEKAGSYTVILKDCSLGEGWPVVCAILIDLKKQSYFVKFAAHPYWPIAIERTLTELMQGRNIHSMVGMTEFHSNVRNLHQGENKISIASTGDGYYPLSFFGRKETYALSEAFHIVGDKQDVSNTEMLAGLVKKLFENGYNLLVRNVSFLGFPSFYMLVPGMSEVISDNDFAIRNAEDKNYIASIGKNIRNASKEELETLIRKIDGTGCKLNAIMSFSLNLKMRKEFKWNKLHYGVLKTNILLTLRRYGEAIDVLNEYIGFLNSQGINAGRMSYYRCIINILEILNEGLTQEEAYQSIRSFFSEEILADAFQAINAPLDNMEPFPCYNCDECAYLEDCIYKDVSLFHRRWKDKYKENVLDQKNMEPIMRRILTEI